MISDQHIDALGDGLTKRFIDILEHGEIVTDKDGQPVLDSGGQPVRQIPSAAMLAQIRQFWNDVRKMRGDGADGSEFQQIIERARGIGDRMPDTDTEREDDATR